ERPRAPSARRSRAGGNGRSGLGRAATARRSGDLTPAVEFRAGRSTISREPALTPASIGRPRGSATRRRPLMLEPPQITQTADQPTAAIHLTVPREEICNVMGPGISEVMATVAAQGIAAAGPWFTHHFRMDPEVF